MEVAEGGSGLGVEARVGGTGVALEASVGVGCDAAGAQPHIRDSERTIVITTEASFFIVYYSLLMIHILHICICASL
jgi:hypothetical protein